MICMEYKHESRMKLICQTIATNPSARNVSLGSSHSLATAGHLLTRGKPDRGFPASRPGSSSAMARTKQLSLVTCISHLDSTLTFTTSDTAYDARRPHPQIVERRLITTTHDPH